MDYLNLAVYVVIGGLLLWLVIMIFETQIYWALKMLLYGALLFIMKFILTLLGFFIWLGITVGWVSAIVAGVLGIPGIILLLLIENFFL